MARLIQLLELIRAHPMLGVALVAGVVIVIVLLQRRPRLQREADAQLAMLRRDKADQYTSLRPPR